MQGGNANPGTFESDIDSPSGGITFADPENPNAANRLQARQGPAWADVSMFPIGPVPSTIKPRQDYVFAIDFSLFSVLDNQGIPQMLSEATQKLVDLLPSGVFPKESLSNFIKIALHHWQQTEDRLNSLRSTESTRAQEAKHSRNDTLGVAIKQASELLESGKPPTPEYSQVTQQASNGYSYSVPVFTRRQTNATGDAGCTHRGI